MDWPSLVAAFRAYAPRLLLPSILIVALGLRLYGIDWDQGHFFHPDERSFYLRADCMYDVLTEAPGFQNGDCIRSNPEMEPGFPGLKTFFDADKSPLNPHWFPLGSILIYLLVIARFIFEPFFDMGSLLKMAYVGRSIMAVADVGTVFMVYLLGKRLWDRRVGLLASSLVALAVVHIQISHFYRPEPLQVFFLMVAFWFMLNVMDRRRLRDTALLGLFVGLALAPKVSVLPLLLPLALVFGFRLFTDSEGKWRVPSPPHAAKIGGHALLAGSIAIGVFFITMPYAFLQFGEFVDQITFQAENVARTAGNVPFTVQYIGSDPFIYELRQTSLWGLGLPLGIAACGGLLFTAFMVFRKWPFHRAELLLLAWVVPNFLLLGFFEVKFMRYIFPIIPFLILMGSWMLLSMLDRARTVSLTGTGLTGYGLTRYAPHAAVAVIAIVVVATAFYALAFETVYARSHPAIQASDWINENVPKRSVIITDNHWDEGIPEIYSYDVQQIPIFDRDTQLKMERVARHLADGDYLIFYSNRTYGSVTRVPERYPMSSQYYQLLFSGELGYEFDRAFTSYPELLGVAFVDDTFSRAGLAEPEALQSSKPAPISLNLGYADENVIAYDHPKVLLFKNSERLSRTEILDRLTSNGSPTPEAPIGLMLSDEQKAAQREGGTWFEIIKRGSWTNDVPVLAWLLMVEIIYLAALPLALFLFRPLPDRGIILARLLGILGVSYVVWLLASLEWMSFSRTSVLVGILTIAALSSLVLVTKWREVKEFLSSHWRLLAIGEVLFIVAFLAFVAIRAANPDLWHPFRGGEKPMDFAYLNAVLRSTYMPPFDPWFAGGYLNYYYWGQFIVATLIKGTGIVPSVAYNLAVPLLFALTVTAAFSLVYNVTAGLRPLSPAGGSPSLPDEEAFKQSYITSPPRWRWRWWIHGVAWGPVAAGLIAGIFVAVMGNLDGIVQLAQSSWDSVVDNQPFPAFDYWRSSRMIPQTEDINPSLLTFWLGDRNFPEVGFHITEFPFFSFLFADLHAHMMIIPFTLLAAGLGFSLLVGLRSASRHWLAAAAVALAVAVGALWAINSWDYPTYILLTVVLIVAGVFLRPGKLSEKRVLLILLAVGIPLLSVLAFLPFHQNYKPFPTGIEVAKWQTPVHNFLGIHGLFLFIVVTFFLYLFRKRLLEFMRSIAPWLSALWTAPRSTVKSLSGVSWTPIIIVAALLPALYMAITGYWTAALMTLLLLPVLWAIKEALSEGSERAAYRVFPLILFALALLIVIGVEFVRAKDDIGRMNTLFKYYLDVWVFMAMASAYVLWYLGSRGFFNWRKIGVFRGVWLVLLVMLVASSFIYTLLGTRARLANRFETERVTLDGADFMKTAVHWEEGQPIQLYWDYEAIRWLQDNVRGSPVILEAHNSQYRWGSRIADYTGLPTVLGWPWHQIQQRMKFGYVVQGRQSVVNELYTTEDMERALDLLRQFEVEYVIVGQLEQVYYPESGLNKFDSMVEDGLARVAHENDGVKIYQAQWYNEPARNPTLKGVTVHGEQQP